MSTAQFLIEQQVRKYESNCRAAISVVQAAKSMWDVQRATRVPVPTLLRGMHLQSRVGAGHQLHQAAERRLEVLLMEQLKEAEAMADREERKAFIGRLRHRDWSALQGYFPRLYRKAAMDGQRLLAKP